MLKTTAVLVLAIMATGCDKAKEPYDKCVKEEAENNLSKALDWCQSAATADPNTSSGKAAAAKVVDLERRKAEEAAQAMAAAEAKAKADKAASLAAAEAMRARWPTMPTTLAAKLRQQAMQDLTHGGATPAMTVITSELGQPQGTYDAGLSYFYVWGAQLGPKPSGDEMKGAPFAVRMREGMTCADYGGNSTEFYSFGNRLWPN